MAVLTHSFDLQSKSNKKYNSNNNDGYDGLLTNHVIKGSNELLVRMSLVFSAMVVHEVTS